MCIIFKVRRWEVCLRGPYPQKMTKLKKNASNEVSKCSGCCCGIQQLCDMCKGGSGAVERHYHPSIFIKYLQKNRSPEKFQFATSNEPNSHSFWARGLILKWKEAEICNLQSYREVFFNFRNQFFRKKCIFLKKYCTRKLKWNLKKIYSFVEHKIPFRLMKESFV